MDRMKKFTFCVVLLHGLFLSIATASAKLTDASSTPDNTLKMVKEGVGVRGDKGKDTEISQKFHHQALQFSPSLSSKLWTLDKKRQVKSEPFIWVVKDAKKTTQPFLEVGKAPADSEKKPSDRPRGAKKDELEPFDDVIKDTQKLNGLFTLYRQKDKNKIYLEIKPEQLNNNYLATATLESGIGEAGIYSGMPLQDFLFYFKRVNNNLNFVVRNVNFRIREGDPQARSLARSFSDSVLYSIPIKSINQERKTILIDLGDLLLTDLAGLSASLGVPGTTDQSYFGSAKAFPQNIEIESVLNFISGSTGAKDSGLQNFGALADNRGYTLRVHYSLSQLPENSYRPRLADERVGYFITAYQDLSDGDRREPFVRYINRWNLEKLDPSAAISPPKKPVVFWIDNAVPFEYRDAIKEGVLMWNKAFEKAGFKDAIQVKQMPDDATWDPADIRYNTIRWINTVDGYFALGPSRVNPLNGEILDADILVDASFVRALKSEYGKIIEPNQTEARTSLSAMMQNRLLCSNGLDAKGNSTPKPNGLVNRISKMAGEYDLCYGMEAANQFAFGKMAMTLLQEPKPTDAQVKQYIHEYLRLIIAHEVGHTLGLRHNFRGSTLLKPEEMNNKEITRIKGLTTSVMDYIPPNIAPQGTKQGDYFPNMLGLYDEWAIAYGYTAITAPTPKAEKPFLDKIAEQSDKPELSYSTDEDVRDLDPTADAWDNSSNVLTYSQWQLDNARVMWDKLDKRYPIEGESYSDVSERFGTVLGNYFQNIYFASKYIGGQSFYRVNGGNSKKRLPFEPVPVEKQRQALEMLQKYIFDESALNFSPELLNKLAPSRWRHWGSAPRTGRLDYPIHDLILFIQTLVLQDLLSADRLSRLKDIELKSQPGKALSLPELFDTLQNGIWTEVLKPNGKQIKISSLRRGLQREYMNMLTGMVLRKQAVPEDARTLAWYKLKQLNEKLDGARSEDEYTKAHLQETRDRINKALNAQLQGN
jgi:Met-zincin/Domain of unknown function (DUF5117)/Domain of unknown function (DUF5118)